ncbi:hypothetical protein Tco_1422087 [Tanacetum coccineum]
MSMLVQKSQVHKTAILSQDADKRLCLVDDFKDAQVHIQVKLYGTSSILKSKITTSCSQDEVKKTSLQAQDCRQSKIDIHFVQDLVPAGQVRVRHVPSRYQYADIFTKGLPSALFEEFRTSLSVRCPSAPTAGECYPVKRRAFWNLNEDILKITILKTNTPYPSRRYGVSVPALTNDHIRLKINTPYPEDSIHRIQDME